ncbi:MAG: RidA family protein [Pseudomonadota bacterium]
MNRVASYPDGHWSLAVDIPYSMGVMQGGLIFTSGQADLIDKGEVCNPGDLSKQTAAAIKHIKSIFSDLGSDIEQLTKLTVFYVNNGSVDQQAYKTEIAKILDTRNMPVVAMVPLTHFFYPGTMVEIDAVGVNDKGARHYVNNSDYGPVSEGFSQALRSGEFIFLGGTTAQAACGEIADPNDSVQQTHLALERIEKILGEFGADRRDLVKLNNWFVIGANAKEWSQSAQVRADFYHEPGPVATGMPLHSLGAEGVCISTDCWGMLAGDGSRIDKHRAWPEGHWDWPVHLPFKHGLKCRDYMFVGGQVSMDQTAEIIDPHSLDLQTARSMQNVEKVLAEFGADNNDILKLNTWYKGVNDPDRDGDTLHASVNIRSSYFSKPGPASTGIPLENLCYENLLTETEVIAYRASK